MASNLTVDTLTKGATTLNTDELVDVNNTRVCKAWVNFNGTGVVAERDSFNISSITDNSTGNYTINFTTAMEDANYCANITYGSSTGGSLQLRSITRGTTAGQRFFITADGTGTGVDTDENNVSIFR